MSLYDYYTRMIQASIMAELDQREAWLNDAVRLQDFRYLHRLIQLEVPGRDFRLRWSVASDISEVVGGGAR